MKTFAGDIILHMCTKNHNHMMYSLWDTEWDKQNLTIFCPFSPLTTQKINISKKWKNSRRYYFTHLHYKWKSCNARFLRYGAQPTEFLSFWTIFLHFFPLLSPPCQKKKQPQKLKFWKKKMKKMPEDIITLQRCIINDNHDVWFLRYRVWWTEFSVIFDCFLHFYPPNNSKNQT